jgi:hypothetical protein
LKAPQYEQADILHACIDRTAYELSDPIDRIEVLPNRVVVSAGSKRVVLIARYATCFDGLMSKDKMANGIYENAMSLLENVFLKHLPASPRPV